MTTAMYAVNGMMCESCMTAVLDNVQGLPGVTGVTMDLVTGGQSPLLVTSRTTLGADAVREAIQHVGFVVQPPKAREQRERGMNLSAKSGDPRPDRGRMFASHHQRMSPAIGSVSS